MQLENYKAYLACFNTQDYDGVVSHFTDDCEIVFADYRLRGRQAIRDFYAFFHAYVDEQIELTRFVSDDQTIALEANVRLTGKGGATQEMLVERGLDKLAFPERGQVIEIPQFIHYHLRDGKFTKALCAIFLPPSVTLDAL